MNGVKTLLRAVCSPSLHAGVASQLALHTRSLLRPPSDHLNGERRVGVLIKGFLAGQGTWGAATRALKEAGCSYAYAPGADLLSLGSMELAVRALREKLRTLPPDKDFVLIGHSLGGVVALRLMKDLEREIRDRVTAIFSLSAPIQGTPLAELLVPLARRGIVGEACLELTPDCPYLRRLDEVDLRGIDVRYHSAGQDVVVPPPSHARVRRGPNERVIDDPTFHHHDYLRADFFAQEIAPVLQAA